MAETNGNKWVSIRIFLWVAGILFALVMGAYTLAGSAMGEATQASSGVDSIERDIEWIKGSLIRIENNLR